MLKSTTTSISELAGKDQFLDQLNQCQQFPAVLKVPVAPCDPLNWLDSQRFAVKFAWSERDEPSMLAGAGVAARVEVPAGRLADQAITQCRERMCGSEEIRFFGGLSFFRWERGMG